MASLQSVGGQIAILPSHVSRKPDFRFSYSCASRGQQWALGVVLGLPPETQAGFW